jgi:hypothetical protein
MKHALTLVLLVSLALPGYAQGTGPATAKVAILSLIGDVMNIDIYRLRVGTSIDANDKTVVPISSPVFDYTAITAAADAVARVVPGASVVTLAVPAPGSASDPARIVVDGAVSPTNSLVSALQRESFTHLLAITRYRGPARLQLADMKVGKGQLQGIGFYVDNYLETQRTDTKESGTGFIAPYVYVRLSLINLQNLQVTNDKTVTASAARSAAANKTGFGAWGALSTEEKVSLLNVLIQESVSAAVPSLFAVK